MSGTTKTVEFTKSAFKIATRCPMQAYYYRNSKGNDPRVDGEKKLKFCEIDTMAKVLVWEYFNNVIKE
jgi:hypothetical protein